MAIDLTLNIQNGLSGGSTDTVINKPTGTVDGDFLLAALTYPNARTMTPPAGWTQLATYDFGTEYRVRVWYKRASSEGSSYTWSADAGIYSDGIIWRLTGVVASGDPSDATPATNEGDGTALSSSSITTGTNGAAVIQLGGTSNDYTSLSSTTLTERWDDGVTLLATGDIQASAGASGAKTGTIGTSRVWGIIMLALKPETGGGEPTPNVYDGFVLSENITIEPEGFYFGHNTAFTGSTDDLTQAFTCEANAKILILALVVAGTTNREYVAPTYNGVDMTQADIVRKYATTPEESCELWYMIDPPVSASYNIVVPNSGTRTLWCKATSFRVSAIGDAIIDTSTGNTGLSANPSVNITTTTNGALIYGVLGDGRNAAPTAETGYNINRTLHSTYSDSNQYYIQTSAGVWACGWTCLSDDWCMCVAAFKLSLGISVADCVSGQDKIGRN